MKYFKPIDINATFKDVHNKEKDITIIPADEDYCVDFKIEDSIEEQSLQVTLNEHQITVLKSKLENILLNFKLLKQDSNTLTDV